MEFFKEFLDEGRSRIKSGFFGSFLFAFIAINWRELFFLAFADVSAAEKIAYFDNHTDFGGYFLGPVILGAVIAAGLPFVNNFFHDIVSAQVSAVRSRDDEHAHERLKKKNEWEEERLREKALYAEKLISEAKIDQEIDQTIQDPTVREDIKAKLTDANKASDRQNKVAMLQSQLANINVQLHQINSEITSARRAQEKKDKLIKPTLSSGFFDKNENERRETEYLARRKADLEAEQAMIYSEMSKL